MIDATFAFAKGGGDGVGPTQRGKGVKSWPLWIATDCAVGQHACGDHHEVTLVQLSFDFYLLEAKAEHLIGDRAYDSDPLDAALAEEGVNAISPHRKNRKKRRLRMAGSYAGTRAVGWWSGSLP
ncbi:MAG TPA: hypothetical protein VEY92_10065, partial [Pseudoxanthomonas sp.]|nr:hypothetical protein [Pseudoxanthomonas sp.]